MSRQLAAVVYVREPPPGWDTRRELLRLVDERVLAVLELDVDPLPHHACHLTAPELRMLDVLADGERLGRSIRPRRLLGGTPRDASHVDQTVEHCHPDRRRDLRQPWIERADDRDVARREL